jgi:hypothetical protein
MPGGSTAYTPAIGGAPFGNLNTNPQSSFYKTISGFSPVESNLIAKAISKTIFDSSPAQYKALRLIFEMQPESVMNDEFEYLERSFGRSALQCDPTSAGAAATAPVAGTIVTQVIPMTAQSVQFVSPDATIIYPDNTQAVVQSIVGNNVTVNSHTSDGLSAVSPGDSFAIMAYNTYDGTNRLTDYERLNTITRYNFIQQFLRARRWGRMELVKYQNSGTTDYLVEDKKSKIEQFRTDLFCTFFNGERGEIQLYDGGVGKTMGGIYPSMIAAGSMSANPTIAGLPSAFETLALKTNFKAEGETRYIYGTQEILHELSKVYKSAGTRYTPNDMEVRLGITGMEFGGMRFGFVPCELFREPSCFPAIWARRLLVLDQQTIKPVQMQGMPFMNIGSTLDRGDNGTREMFKDFFVEGNCSLKFNNPLASFIIDVL